MLRGCKALLGAITLAVGLSGAAKAADWPSGPVEVIVPYAAGGGTDATARFLAQVFQEKLNQPFNVVNRTGGGGIVGLEALVNAKADGSVIGVTSADLSTFKWFGQTTLTYRDVAMVGIYNMAFPTLMVAEDSPFKTAKEAFDAIKADPKKYKLHIGSSIGNSYHISFVGIAAAYGINPAEVPTVTGTGAVNGVQELAAGAVDFSLAALAEADALMRSGKVRPLLVLGQEKASAMPDLPTAKEALDVDWQFGVWRGVAAPKNTDPAVLEKMRTAFAEAYATDQFKQLMSAQGFDVFTVPQDQIEAFVDKSEAAAGEALKQIGVVK
ncbi:MAG: tripartite tricarboxylate transporter substrate binding protein [Rhizobiaceae bacterium]|nr:tripartite tricarboxylate transporter substrate binding protein [Rhizobiaceae bacterium]